MMKLVSGKSMKKTPNQKKEKEKWSDVQRKLQEFDLLKAKEAKEEKGEIDAESRKNWLKLTIESFCNLCEMIK